MCFCCTLSLSPLRRDNTNLRARLDSIQRDMRSHFQTPFHPRDAHTRCIQACDSPTRTPGSVLRHHPVFPNSFTCSSHSPLATTPAHRSSTVSLADMPSSSHAHINTAPRTVPHTAPQAHIHHHYALSSSLASCASHTTTHGPRVRTDSGASGGSLQRWQ